MGICAPELNPCYNLRPDGPVDDEAVRSGFVQSGANPSPAPDRPLMRATEGNRTLPGLQCGAAWSGLQTQDTTVPVRRPW